jgi:putative hydrolase of the HAD superfamily
VKVIAFDWGHTVMDECRDREVPLTERTIHLMPGVSDVLPRLSAPLALWANTRTAAEGDVRQWLGRAGLDGLFRWVITSVDAGARKPARQFFSYALARCDAAADKVLFVGNQLNTDVAGGTGAGISTVWLSGPEYRSADDGPCGASPTCTIQTLYDLPALLHRRGWR